MSPKVTRDIGPFQVFTFANENGEPVHIHVSRGGNHNSSLKFWLRNDDWVLDKNQSNLKVTPNEYKTILKYLRANTADILHGLYRFHNVPTGNLCRMNLD